MVVGVRGGGRGGVHHRLGRAARAGRGRNLDPADGRVLWRTAVYGWAWGRPAVTDSTVYLGAVGSEPYEIRHLGSLTAMDRKTGKGTWRWPMPEWPGSLLNGFAASPVIDGKMLFIGGVDGCLYAFPIGLD